MSEPGCKWVSSTKPRVVPGRHGYGCNNEACPGCQPCERSHCRIDGRTHVDQGAACPECVAEVRSDLREIGQQVTALPAEVKHRGIHGEAMMLLGPAADPEAWNHRGISALAGRIVPVDCEAKDVDELHAWLEKADHELHPLTIVGTWDFVYRDAFDHDSGDVVTVASAIDYLDQNLTYAASWPHVPFEDMAKDLRRCLAHIKRVLHDQDQGDRANVGCFECRGDLERKLTEQGFEDHWTCRVCRRRYTSAEYNFALRAAIEEKAQAS